MNLSEDELVEASLGETSNIEAREIFQGGWESYQRYSGDDNDVAIYFEADNLDKFMELMDTPATAEAMEFDGVKRETVKIFVLDKVFDL